MTAMFDQATSFNDNITQWDVSSVTRFPEMFAFATSFNQNISSWNVSQADNMSQMFLNSSAFNQNLCSWGNLLPQDADVNRMFRNSACEHRSDTPDLSLAGAGPFCFAC